MPTWRFEYEPSDVLPPLAWVARIQHPRVVVACGSGVRREPHAFFEGTWVGAPGLASVVQSTTPFGSGMVLRDGEPVVVPPGHSLATIYAHRAGTDLLVANTLVGLLESRNLELLPDVDYTTLFFRLAEGLENTPIELPTTGGLVESHYFENVRVTRDGRLEKEPKPREQPFRSYEDYVGRLEAALVSALANAPKYEPVIALSNGYDSPAMAVLAARHGCRTALVFKEARPPVTTRDPSDSGEDIAHRLGMAVRFFDRAEYQRRSDLPEAEFLATGYTGEDVALLAFEPALQGKALITGGLGAAMWRLGREPHGGLYRADLSACSLTEYRLRVNFIDLPVSILGMTEMPSVQALTRSAEMRPWSIGGPYDKPIPRRIVEEAGFERGTFATHKRAATALLHQQGEAVMAPDTVAAVRQFAAAEGKSIDLTPRRRPTRTERGLVKLAKRAHAERLVASLIARERAIVAHRPDTGSILFRWAVAQLRPRYSTLRQRDTTRAGND